jgi:hypothetical protein
MARCVSPLCSAPRPWLTAASGEANFAFTCALAPPENGPGSANAATSMSAPRLVLKRTCNVPLDVRIANNFSLSASMSGTIGAGLT